MDTRRMQDLLEQLRDANLDDLRRMSLREDVIKMLCTEHFAQNEPTEQDIRKVLELYKFQITLKPQEVLRMWIWKQLDGTPAYAVAKELDLSRTPSEDLVQLMINEHIQDLREQWKRNAPDIDTSGTMEAYEVEIRRTEALMPVDVLKTIDICVRHKLPPFN